MFKKILVVITIIIIILIVVLSQYKRQIENKSIDYFFNKGNYKTNIIKYLMVLDIPKINLKKGVCNFFEDCNNVNKNIEIHIKSDLPNEENGSIIIMGHNGNSKISFFKTLDKLNINDIIYIHYENKTYEYILNEIYDINKNGKASFIKDEGKNALFLITCKKKEKDKQTIYLSYLNDIIER
ncbi:MAG: sortase [Mollicutes bacterium]|nr:sortase [Mollicutes bacterium]